MRPTRNRLPDAKTDEKSACLESLVEGAARVLSACGPDDDDLEALAVLDCDELLKRRLHVFVPLGFGRYFFPAPGPRFSPTFLVADPEALADRSRDERRMLEKEPVFLAATRVALRLLQTDEGRALVRAVGRRSSEVVVAERLLTPGSNPEALVLTEVVVLSAIGPGHDRPRWWWPW